MMRGGQTHRGAMRVHSIRRLYERHGILITNAEFAEMVTAIANGSNPSVARARAGGTLHAVTIRERTVYAVWSDREASIATFLPGIPWELRYPKITQASA